MKSPPKKSVTICEICGPVLVLFLALTLSADTATRPANPLASVKTFMYQLQNLEDPKSVDALAKSSYDLLVIEPTATTKDNAAFDMKAMIAKLRTKPDGSRRILLAYLNAGEAESYRRYWKENWKAPTRSAAGSPDFLLVPDPDGWSGNYPVAYWEKPWQDIFATAADSEVNTVMAAGFDGVYLDWIDAYSDDRVTAAAKKAHIDPARAMVDFLVLIRKTARAHNPNAIIIQQNAIGLLDADPRLKDAIDGLGVEDTWFSGKANAKWNSKNAGDIPNHYKDESSTAGRLVQYQKYLAAGKPVFSIDYCLKPENVAHVYAEARKARLVPLVTQVSLDHLTTTPPP